MMKVLLIAFPISSTIKYDDKIAILYVPFVTDFFPSVFSQDDLFPFLEPCIFLIFQLIKMFTRFSFQYLLF